MPSADVPSTDSRLLSTDDAYDTVHRLGTIEGILVGQSSGPVLFAALRLARTLEGGTIVTIFPDFGDRYLSTNLWIGWQQQ